MANNRVGMDNADRRLQGPNGPMDRPGRSYSIPIVDVWKLRQWPLGPRLLGLFLERRPLTIGNRAKQRPSSSHLSFWPPSARHSDLDVRQDGDHHCRGQRARRPLERQAHCSRIEEGAVERTREARGQHDPMSRRRPVPAGKLLWPSQAGCELTDSSKVDTRGRSWAQQRSASRCGSTTCDITPPTQTGSIVTVSLCSV